jgi:kynureninase
MSPEVQDLPGVDLEAEPAERIRRRAQRELRRWSDPFARTWFGRLERAWIARMEPTVAAIGSLALVAWAFAVVAGG